MSHVEFLKWTEFFKLYPFDDKHRYHRPAALVASSNTKGDQLRKFLDWLQPDPQFAGYTDADIATMRAFGFHRKGE